MTPLGKPGHKGLSFLRREDGGLTVANILFLLTAAILGGIAIDVANVVSARTQLQATADAAAHAALVEREWHTPQEAKSKALAVALQNMPEGQYGDVLTEKNIIFGDYDRETGTFTANNNSRNAVLVQTERLSKNGNAVTTFLLQFVGLWDWDVRTTSLFETWYPTCLLEGFVAQGVIDIQSNNSYFNGFCMHSNSYVTINNNNYFESGTVVSMPDINDLVVTTNGQEEPKNEGLQEALREGKYFIKIVDRLDKIVAGLQDRSSRYARDYINNYNLFQVEKVQGNNILTSFAKVTVGPNDLRKGRINKVNCTSELTLDAGTYQDIVLISDCAIKVSNNVIIENSVVISKATTATAISGSHIVLGKDDNCAEDGGAQLLSYGGVNFASTIEMYGSQIIARGDVDFEANGDGMEGASVVAGGKIDSTSNLNFAFCGSGMKHSFLAEYFRLAG